MELPNRPSTVKSGGGTNKTGMSGAIKGKAGQKEMTWSAQGLVLPSLQGGTWVQDRYNESK